MALGKQNVKAVEFFTCFLALLFSETIAILAFFSLKI